MQSTDDSALLRQYAENRSDEAFTSLVARYVNMVYSVALRSVWDVHHAEEVTQSVFILLAKKAGQLRHDKALSSWLFQTTRLTAQNYLRSESRRNRREVEAHMQSVPNDSESDIWPRIEPLLDEAVAELDEIDRQAVVLRFYEGRSLRDIGVALGSSEDAAQKRVSRAVERLREFFAKRGVSVGASGLAAVVSANAVQAAPAGLCLSVTATISTFAPAASITTSAAKTIAMTTMQKSIVTSILAAAIGVAIYETHDAARLRMENSAVRSGASPQDEALRALGQELTDATNQLAALDAENARLRNDTAELLRLRNEVSRLRSNSKGLAGPESGPGADPVVSEAVLWKERVGALKAYLERNPAGRIPEMEFASEQDWLNAARGKLETEEDFRRATSAVRNAVQSAFAGKLQKALSKYLAASKGTFPTDATELQAYLETPVDEAVLQRYVVLPKDRISSLGMGGDWIITQRAPVDEEFDTRIGIGPHGWGTTGPEAWDDQAALAKTHLGPVIAEYVAANGGLEPSEPSDLIPFLKTPEQRVAYEKALKYLKLGKK